MQRDCVPLKLCDCTWLLVENKELLRHFLVSWSFQESYRRDFNGVDVFHHCNTNGQKFVILFVIQSAFTVFKKVLYSGLKITMEDRQCESAFIRHWISKTLIPVMQHLREGSAADADTIITGFCLCKIYLWSLEDPKDASVCLLTSKFKIHNHRVMFCCTESIISINRDFCLGLDFFLLLPASHQ